LLNVAVFSTGYSSGPTADDIYDDAIVPANAVISDSCFCWHAYCVGGPVVVFIHAVACVPAVGSSHDIAVILAVACCWYYCSCLLAWIQTVAGILAVSGVLLVPDGLQLLVSLLLLGLPVLLAFLLFLSYLLLLAILLLLAFLLLMAFLLLLGSLLILVKKKKKKKKKNGHLLS
jgi:hypothetical protein